MRSVGHFVHRAMEGRFVCFRRVGETGELSDKLERRCPDFILPRRWREIMQGFDGSAHGNDLTADGVVSKVESISRMKTDFSAIDREVPVNLVGRLIGVNLCRPLG